MYTNYHKLDNTEHTHNTEKTISDKYEFSMIHSLHR